jgi:DNA modification methylase
METNREYILIEREQKYVDIINKRIDEHVTVKQPTQSLSNPLASALY